MPWRKPSISISNYFEGFGLVHLEANACGTMTIGTINSSNEDAIPKGNGFLVEQNDVQGLACAINKLLSCEVSSSPRLPVWRTWKEVGFDYMNNFSLIIDVEKDET